MKYLLLVVVFLTGFFVGALLSTANAGDPLPAWLHLEAGDVERCAGAPGGCSVWTDRELLSIINVTRNREREKCGKII